MEKLQSVEVAVEWWANKIQTPTVYDNGDTSKTGAMTSLLASMLASNARNGLNSEQIQKFKEILSNLIYQEIENYGFSTLTVDYQPQGILGEAAMVSQIDESLFPWKTNMSIYTEQVVVSEGYRKEYETIYPVKTMKK